MAGRHRSGDTALRRGVLAVSVLDDVPLEPDAAGVRVGASWDDARSTWTPVPWSCLHDALIGADPEEPTGRLRLRDWLRAVALLGRDRERVRELAVPLALPAGHALHPGRDWVREQLLGGALDLGIGLRPDPFSAAVHLSPAERLAGTQTAVPLPTTALAWAGVDAAPWWPFLRQRVEAMGRVTRDRLVRDDGRVVSPVGGCDALTLLASPSLRAHLAGSDGTGMRAVAAPMRTRAWFDLSRIDPAYVGAAATATEPEQRGIGRPLLVTVDEVGLAPRRERVVDLVRAALADPAAPIDLTATERDVRWR
ncbi:hypothetical protein [Angustibacter aerolatus]